MINPTQPNHETLAQTVARLRELVDEYEVEEDNFAAHDISLKIIGRHLPALLNALSAIPSAGGGEAQPPRYDFRRFVRGVLSEIDAELTNRPYPTGQGHWLTIHAGIKQASALLQEQPWAPEAEIAELRMLRDRMNQMIVVNCQALACSEPVKAAYDAALAKAGGGTWSDAAMQELARAKAEIAELRKALADKDAENIEHQKTIRELDGRNVMLAQHVDESDMELDLSRLQRDAALADAREGRELLKSALIWADEMDPGNARAAFLKSVDDFLAKGEEGK